MTESMQMAGESAEKIPEITLSESEGRYLVEELTKLRDEVIANFGSQALRPIAKKYGSFEEGIKKFSEGESDGVFPNMSAGYGYENAMSRFGFDIQESRSALSVLATKKAAEINKEVEQYLRAALSRAELSEGSENGLRRVKDSRDAGREIDSEKLRKLLPEKNA